MSIDTLPAPAGSALPAPGTWTIDQAHSNITFSARHLGLSKVRGRFGQFTGEIQIAGTPEDTRVRVEIATDSVSTNSEQRDGHLRSPDFLDVANHPTMDFVSTSIERDGDDYRMTGDLTIRGVTQPVTLDVEFDGHGPDPFSGGQRMAFSARTSINREDWGLTWNAPLETGQILVGKKVGLEFEVAATSAPVESSEEIREDAASS